MRFGVGALKFFLSGTAVQAEEEQTILIPLHSNPPLFRQQRAGRVRGDLSRTYHCPNARTQHGHLGEEKTCGFVGPIQLRLPGRRVEGNRRAHRYAIARGAGGARGAQQQP